MTKRVFLMLPGLAKRIVVVVPTAIVILGIGIKLYKGAALSASVGISLGERSLPVVARMSSIGFDCQSYSVKYIDSLPPPSRDDIVCSKREPLGLGIAGVSSAFLLAIVPSEWLYAFLPKSDATVTYRESEIVFTFNNEILTRMTPSVQMRYRRGPRALGSEVQGR